MLHLKDRLAARAPQLLGPASSMVRAGRNVGRLQAAHCHACMHACVLSRSPWCCTNIMPCCMHDTGKRTQLTVCEQGGSLCVMHAHHATLDSILVTTTANTCTTHTTLSCSLSPHPTTPCKGARLSVTVASSVPCLLTAIQRNAHFPHAHTLPVPLPSSHPTIAATHPFLPPLPPLHAPMQRLIWSGRQLHDADLLGSALQRSHTSHTSQPAWATLQLTHRLLGGGGDGGSTGAESRSCYLEMYAGKKIEKVSGGVKGHSKKWLVVWRGVGVKGRAEARAAGMGLQLLAIK